MINTKNVRVRSLSKQQNVPNENIARESGNVSDLIRE